MKLRLTPALASLLLALLTLATRYYALGRGFG